MRWVLALVGLLLVACAPLVPQPAKAPEKRYEAPELLALRPDAFSWPAASEQGERELREAELATLRQRLALPAGPERDAALPAIFEAIALFNAERAAGLPLLLAALPSLPERDANTQRALLTAAYSLYPQESAPLILPLLPRLQQTRPFAIAAYTLLKSDPSQAGVLRGLLMLQFPSWAEDARLTALMQRLSGPDQATPPLADLLAAPLRPGYPVLFSLQRPGRQHLGLALVRGADGRFVREANGALFASPQLALALTGLPGTITNGNTPQGLFTVVGVGTASNPWIGPTPYLHSKLPIEATVGEFEHTDTTAPWSEAVYESFLPESWRGHAPIKEAWLAGRAGRDEILAHGSVVNPAYYAEASYFPGTPSAGCLVSHEEWEPGSGRLLRSGQLQLAQTFARAGGREQVRGYLVVVEVAGEAAVTPAEAEAWVAQAGR